MLKKVGLFLITFLFLFTYANAQYFYFWADTYEALVDTDGTAFINTHLKTSDGSTFDFSVDGKTIAENLEAPSEMVVDYPLVISSKYTQGKDHLIVCSFKHNSVVDFKQEVCLKINLLK